MSQYLLSTYFVQGEVPGGSSSPEEMQAFMERVIGLEAEMDETDTFVFGGALHGPDAATVVGPSDGDVVMTDGPFAESKEHIGGFYVINADDLDDALAWAGKVAHATNHPIEVRPFRATGRVADHVHEMPGA
ncbi:MAG: YciI family protein [Acidimicrobiia bacterium]